MSKELAKTYDPKGLEDRLYQKWMDKNYFHAEVDETKKPFTIVIPPPNITGQLHMGHALDNTMQDILIRYKRMQGYNALWQPGTDHASIATEVRIIEKLKEEGTSKEELGKIRDEKEMLEILMEESQGAYIKVDGNIYRNVVIGVNVEQLTLNRGTGFMIYTADNGVLEGNVIVH